MRYPGGALAARWRHAVGRSLAVWVLVAVGLRVVVVLPEHCPAVTAATAGAAVERAIDWFGHNLEADGRWRYRYRGPSGETLGGYEPVRHAGVLFALYLSANRGHPRGAAAGEDGLGWALAHLVVNDRWTALSPVQDGLPFEVGGTALLVAALVERRRWTGDSGLDPTLRSLGAFLTTVIRQDGSVPATVGPQGEPAEDQPSPFYTGETFMALARLAAELPAEGWQEPALQVGRYLAQRRDAAEGWFPPVADHWAAYGLAELNRWPDDAAGLATVDPGGAYARRLAALAGVQIRYESQRTDRLPSRITRGRRTLGAGLGTLGESLGNLWSLADPAAGRSRLQGRQLTERDRCAAGMLIERQMSVADATSKAWPDPERAAGAWYQFGVTQMDDQQHALAALVLAEAVLAATPQAAESAFAAADHRAADQRAAGGVNGGVTGG